MPTKTTAPPVTIKAATKTRPFRARVQLGLLFVETPHVVPLAHWDTKSPQGKADVVEHEVWGTCRADDDKSAARRADAVRKVRQIDRALDAYVKGLKSKKKLLGYEAQLILRRMPFREAFDAVKRTEEAMYAEQEAQREACAAERKAHNVVTFQELPADVQTRLDKWSAKINNDKPRARAKRNLDALCAQADAVLLRVERLGWSRWSYFPTRAVAAAEMISPLHLLERARDIEAEWLAFPFIPRSEIKVGDLIESTANKRVVYYITEVSKRGNHGTVIGISEGAVPPYNVPTKLDITGATSAVGTGRSSVITAEYRRLPKEFWTRHRAITDEYNEALRLATL